MRNIGLGITGAELNEELLIHVELPIQQKQSPDTLAVQNKIMNKLNKNEIGFALKRTNVLDIFVRPNR